MDLSTTYLGLKLPHPLMPGASPLVDDLDTVRKLEDTIKKLEKERDKLKAQQAGSSS